MNQQIAMFQDGSDLPLFSGTPVTVTLDPFSPTTQERQVKMFCGKRLFGFMPPCVLPAGHAGDCTDGFGGFYSHGEAQP